ncbi:MAG: glycosyltransferase [Alphaproteobacteria bacterium GM202ARS2]|nr:glycosyltransferase [Alphaproteobacteria bacterium GM202ARS2]
MTQNDLARIVSQSDLAEIRKCERDRCLVLATGCFDLVHKGHIHFLGEAAAQGDVLVVGINDDRSVRELKGPSRPIVSGADRGAVLAAFGCVDYVYEYPERCAGVSIELLKPDVFCVGEESIGAYLDEIEAARRNAVRIHPIPKVKSSSTTTMVDHIQQTDAGKDPLVISVIYVNWNTRQLLKDSIESLKKHRGNCSLEIIVVDNNSKDGTVEWLQAEHPDVLAVPLTKNVGFSVGNNKGREVATGDYLLLLNTDTVVLPSTLPGMVSAIESDITIGCVGARHLNADRTLQRSMDSFPNLVADLLTHSELHRLPWVARWLGRRHAWWSAHDRTRQVDWVNGACMLFRREAFDEAAGFDPEIFIYGEEVDLCRRLWNNGWKVVFSTDAEIVHLGGAAMDHVAAYRLFLNYKGLIRFYDKHKGWASRLGIRTIVLGTLLARFVLFLPFAALPSRWIFVRRIRGVLSQMGSEASLSEIVRAWSRIAATIVT